MNERKKTKIILKNYENVDDVFILNLITSDAVVKNKHLFFITKLIEIPFNFYSLYLYYEI